MGETCFSRTNDIVFTSLLICRDFMSYIGQTDYDFSPTLTPCHIPSQALSIVTIVCPHAQTQWQEAPDENVAP